MNQGEIKAALKQRRPWLIACGLFPFMALVTQIAVFPGSTKSGTNFWTLDGMTVVTACIGLRLLVGLALAERRWKAWFYFFLSIPFAIVIVWIEQVARNPPPWLDM